MPVLTVLDVLLGAAAVLDAEDRYTARSCGATHAVDANGKPCGYTTDRAAAFTVLGACKLAARNLDLGKSDADLLLAWDAFHAVEQILGQRPRVPYIGPVYWTVDSWRKITYSMVVDAIDQAILGVASDRVAS